MTKRELTREEKDLNLKGIKSAEQELDHLQYLLDYTELMLQKGLQANYIKAKKKYEADRNSLMDEFKLNKTKISVLKKQIKEGVECQK